MSKENNYKFKEMRPYGSLETLYQGNRRYRLVLDEQEVTYMNVELTFYNRQFDREDWQTTTTLRAVELARNIEICKLEKAITITKDQQMITIRDGWGTPNPGFWKKGTYKWEAYIDGKLIGEVNFYITNVGLVNQANNPFFNIQAIRLFESPYEGTHRQRRSYLSAFNAATTRYVNVEVLLESQLTHLDQLPLEIHFYVYNDRHYLKAYMTHFMHINDQRREITFDTGYGTRDPGFWQKGIYTIQMVFMDTIIATIPFEVGDQDMAFTGTYPLQTTQNQVVLPPPTTDNSISVVKKEPVSRYKIKEIKTYGSLESFYEGARKYRCVFDEAEISYVNVELAFYNIMFNEEDWETTVVLRAINHATYYEICKLEKKISVTQDQNIVYVRDGWGTPEPGFWKEGTYKWEVLIDGKVSGETFFYITSIGVVMPGNNPYFDIKSIKLFESPYEGLPKEQRKYFSAFNSAKARYINVELALENLLTHIPSVPLEFQVAVYNDTHQLKAFMTMFRHVGSHETEILLETGYGTRDPGFWYKDYYTLELRFMDQIVAVVGFEVGEEDVETAEGLDWDNDNWQAEPETELTFEEAKAQLDELIGLKVVKDQINDLATYLRYIKLVGEKKGKQQTGIARQINLHSIFMGNPGTGKTTVANMLGKIYKSLGVLNNGKVHEVGRAELVAEYIGQTAPKVKKAIEQARGGILFIDEAYSLSNRGDDEKDFGREVIEVLLKEMSDGKGDIAIICAGYTKEMESFMKANPGLTSRFGQVIDFPDYTPDELMQIADYTANKKEVMLDGEARQAIYFEVVEAWRNRNRNFGNARFVNGVIEEAKKNMALRLMAAPNPEDFTAEELVTISQGDIDKIFKKGKGKPVALPIDNDLLQKSLAELNALVGLSNIKTEVNEQVKLVRYYIEIGRDVRTSFSLHTVFSGNPGTGKTTVARILAQIYKALGILERGHLVETDRKGIVAGYVGQTAIKATETIDSAMGGCLFIDEAYSLTQGGGTDFGREAIETLLKRMEDDRGKFMVIVAGYTKEMQQFLESNPGLKSRFDKHFYFKDYTEPELIQIAEELFSVEAVKMDTAAKAVLQRYLSSLRSNKSKFFGNGRAVRKIVAETVRQQHLRLAGMTAEQRNADIIGTITPADLDHLRNNPGDTEDNRGMGFQIKG